MSPRNPGDQASAMSRQRKLAALLTTVVVGCGITVYLLTTWESKNARMQRILKRCGQLLEDNERAHKAGQSDYVSPGLPRSDMQFLLKDKAACREAVLKLADSNADEDKALAVGLASSLCPLLELRDEELFRVFVSYLYWGEDPELLDELPRRMWQLAICSGNDRLEKELLQILYEDGGRHWRRLARATKLVFMARSVGGRRRVITSYLDSEDADVRRGAALALGLCFAEKHHTEVALLLRDASSDLKGCDSIGLSMSGDILQNIVTLSECRDPSLRAWGKVKLEGYIPGTTWPPPSLHGRHSGLESHSPPVVNPKGGGNERPFFPADHP